MKLAGKTIARVEYDERLFFTDGTSATTDDYGLHYHDWAETQTYLRGRQGVREQRRMRRLHDTLHPRDQQYLKRLADDRRQEQRKSLSAFSRALEDTFVESMRAQMEDANRMFFGPWPKVKRKQRPPRKIDPSKTYVAGHITIPIKKRG